jgi:hypothetical protein
MVAVKKSQQGRIKSSKHDGSEEETTWGELKAASVRAMKKSQHGVN